MAAIAVTAAVAPFGAASAAPVTGTVTGGQSILNARPLQGGIGISGTPLSDAIGSAWYSLYKTPSSTPATLAIADNDLPGDCATLNVTLLDNNGRSDKPVDSTTLNAGGTVTLNLPASRAGDPQGLYYLEVLGNGGACFNGNYTLPYSVDQEPAGQFAAPAAPKGGTAVPGMSIGSAWPELLGGHLYERPTPMASAAPFWYSFYKRSDSTAGTIRILVGDTCAPSPITFTLLDANGYADAPVTSATLKNGDSAVTLTIPGHRSGDPSGLYYLVGKDKYSCLDFTIEPEPSAEFVSHPAAAWPQPVPGTSAVLAWPNLIGDRRYLASLGSKTPHTRWFTLGKLRGAGPATVRVMDSGGPGSSGCVVRLFNSPSAAARPVAAKVLNANQAVTFNVPARRAGGSGTSDKYYLSLGNASGCGDVNQSSDRGYIIEPEPVTAWGLDIHAAITRPARSSATGLRTGANYAGTLTASRRQVWAKFTVSAPASFMATIVTPPRTGSCPSLLTLRDPAGHLVTYQGLTERVLKLPLRTKGGYYLRVAFPPSCKPASTYEFLVQVRS